jgi:Tetracyclin repressor-like, C-terminal domain
MISPRSRPGCPPYKGPPGSFPDWKRLFAREVVLRYVQREAEHIERVLRSSKLSPLKRLRLYFKELSKIYGQTRPLSGCLLGAFSLEVSKHSEVLRALLSESFQAWKKAIEEVCGGGSGKGAFTRYPSRRACSLSFERLGGRCGWLPRISRSSNNQIGKEHLKS